ncbi:hypothetical protein L1280_001523 [Deinococcus sp. HSC-46F16]|uniref:hypothetical protein n=1 Tax=Deinococcus sp. HSC-46F16 TaxID=2910968 RepID=UPI00209DCD3F|nr:hypothetical protein [Deinococcus sp. HSC-46F16]MCP2014386.1 hypothetical protein [Deinococcus sp. HSC-46F16]
MMRASELDGLRQSIQDQAHQLAVCLLPKLEAYLAYKQVRHDLLTKRYERVERKTENITDPMTERSQKLLAEYERLSEQHARSEEELDDLENLVLEPLREAQDVLERLVG